MAREAEVLERFEALAKTGALSHGYILYGASLKRQSEIAKKLAFYLEQGSFEVSSKTLVDMRFLDGETEKLGVDVSRSFSEFLYLQPAVSKRRTLIVSGAHALTTQAQNALLKIAEEPPAASLVILVVRDLGVLLPPLLSRFQKVFVSGARMEDEVDGELYGTVRSSVGKFLGMSAKGKSEFIKVLVKERPEEVELFMVILLEVLKEKPKEYSKALSELLKRYTAINQFSVNKRLQLETIIDFL